MCRTGLLQLSDGVDFVVGAQSFCTNVVRALERRFRVDREGCWVHQVVTAQAAWKPMACAVDSLVWRKA